MEEKSKSENKIVTVLKNAFELSLFAIAGIALPTVAFEASVLINQNFHNEIVSTLLTPYMMQAYSSVITLFITYKYYIQDLFKPEIFDRTKLVNYLGFATFCVVSLALSSSYIK